MILETFSFFHYGFLLVNENGTRNIDIDDIQNWCNENCNGRWMTIDANSYRGGSEIKINYFSSSLHESPISGEVYPPSKISKSSKNAIMFDEESDAMAFKLYFTEVETND